MCCICFLEGEEVEYFGMTRSQLSQWGEDESSGRTEVVLDSASEFLA